HPAQRVVAVFPISGPPPHIRVEYNLRRPRVPRPRAELQREWDPSLSRNGACSTQRDWSGTWRNSVYVFDTAVQRDRNLQSVEALPSSKRSLVCASCQPSRRPFSTSSTRTIPFGQVWELQTSWIRAAGPLRYGRV